MPLVQLTPPLVEVEKPIATPPPGLMRPIWKVVTMVDPKAKACGSTSDACCPGGLVKVSALMRVSGTSCCG